MVSGGRVASSRGEPGKRAPQGVLPSGRLRDSETGSSGSDIYKKHAGPAVNTYQKAHSDNSFSKQESLKKDIRPVDK